MRKSSSTWKVLVRPETTEPLWLELKTPDPKNLRSFPHQHRPSVLPFPLQSTSSPHWPVSDFCIPPPKNPSREDQPSHPTSVRSKQRGFTANQSQTDPVAKLKSEVLNVCPKKASAVSRSKFSQISSSRTHLFPAAEGKDFVPT